MRGLRGGGAPARARSRFLRARPILLWVAVAIRDASGFPSLPEWQQREHTQQRHPTTSEPAVRARDLAAKKIFVMTSHFALEDVSNKDARKQHYSEVEHSLAANWANPRLAGMHVIYEPRDHDNCTTLRERLKHRISLYWQRIDNIVPQHRTDTFAPLTCEEQSQQPTYHEMLTKYPLSLCARGGGDCSDTIVVVLNADVVLDTTVQRLKTLQQGHIAVLSVNTGPTMENCCFDLDAFHKKALNVQKNKVAFMYNQSNPDRLRSCTYDQCQSTLPDSDKDPHVVALRFMYQRWKDAGLCMNERWSSKGWQWCGGRPKKAEGAPIGATFSWDGFALTFPLPAEIMQDSGWLKTNGTDIYMNQQGAENRAACALAHSGLMVHNTCRYVRLAHWHCSKKTHHNPQVTIEKREGVFPGLTGQLSDSCGVMDVETSCTAEPNLRGCGGIDTS